MSARVLDFAQQTIQHRHMSMSTSFTSRTSRTWLLALLVTGGVASSAQAQTRIGNVTLSSPSAKPANQPNVKKAGQTAAAIPSNWRQVRGKISLTKAASLPAGSQVHVFIEDITVPGKPKQMLKVKFGARSLPTNYYMYYNPAKYSSKRMYAIRAQINDASGKVLHGSYAATFKANTPVVNVTLKNAY